MGLTLQALIINEVPLIEVYQLLIIMAEHARLDPGYVCVCVCVCGVCVRVCVIIVEGSRGIGVPRYAQVLTCGVDT